MGQCLSYGLNDRGRLTTITRNGEDVATYIHDESEQRIAKTADGVTTHYHYDLDGCLISETDGTTGETLRDYVWLALMPIAIRAACDALWRQRKSRKCLRTTPDVSGAICRCGGGW